MSISSVLVKKVTPAEIIGLRHRVLRPGRPIETASFDGDNSPSARHFGLFLKDTGPIVCCVSYFLNSYQGIQAWQLRGMATDEDFRGRGYGGILLARSEELLSAKYEWLFPFWCNARIEAVRLYEKAGWRFQTGIFEIPGVGPHRVMTKGF